MIFVKLCADYYETNNRVCDKNSILVSRQDYDITTSHLAAGLQFHALYRLYMRGPTSIAATE